MPAFYNRPQSVDDIVNHTVGRLLDLFGLDSGPVKRWGGVTDTCIRYLLSIRSHAS